MGLKDEKTLELGELLLSCLVIADAARAGCPILFCSRNYEQLFDSYQDEPLGQPMFRVRTLWFSGY